MKENNVILNKSMDFAVRIVNFSRYLREIKCEFALINQVLRSGTSIGANVHEAVRAQSRKDFVAKMSIALKEASETLYWLEILSRTGIITAKQYNSINADCLEIVKILVSINKTSRIEPGSEEGR